jgi:hypothetical protein
MSVTRSYNHARIPSVTLKRLLNYWVTVSVTEQFALFVNRVHTFLKRTSLNSTKLTAVLWILLAIEYWT